MRHVLFAMACILLNANYSAAQDVIHLLNGEEIKAVVKSIDDDKIEYVKFTNQNGPKYFLSKSRIFKIVYENGEFDLFNTMESSSSLPVNSNNTTKIESTGTGNSGSTKVKSNTNTVNFDVGKVFDNSKSSGSLENQADSNKQKIQSNGSTNAMAVKRECEENKSGDVLLKNETTFPLIVFLYYHNDEYFQTVNIPVGGEQTVYSLNATVHKYQFHPENAGQFDPKTNKIIQYFESYGSFRVTQCDTIKVKFQR